MTRSSQLAAWAEAARALDARCSPPLRVLESMQWEPLEAILDQRQQPFSFRTTDEWGTEVVAELKRIHGQGWTETRTVVRAKVTGQRSFQLRARPRRALGAAMARVFEAALGQRFGLIDYRLRTETNSPELASAWLDEDTRQLLTKAKGYTFTVEEGRAQAVLSSPDHNADRLVAAFQALAGLAGGGVKLLRQVEEVTGRLGGRLRSLSDAWAADPSTSAVFERTSTRARMDWVSQRSHTQSRARVFTRFVLEPRLPSDLHLRASRRKTCWTDARSEGFQKVSSRSARFDRSYDLFLPSPEGVGGHVPPPLFAALLGLSPEHVHVDDEQCVVVMRGIIVEEKKLRQALELCDALVAPRSFGPYR